MSIWFALVVPLIGAFVMLKWFRKNLAWWEVVVPLMTCILFTVIFKFTVEKVQVNDTEYHGALITEARYYEYWETYVHKTCSRTTKVGKSTITTYYDCSYCDRNPERWTVVNSLGNEFTVSKTYYEQLIKKWKATPKFFELNRDIDYSGSCGQDGDMYFIKWNKLPLTAESTTTDHWYENRVQAAHTAFDFPDVTEEDVKTYRLYDYPEIEGFHQETALGIDSIVWLKPKEKAEFKQWSKFLNGHLGTRKHVRIYYLFFLNSPQQAAFMQEAYWDGGNDNELVICIGVNSKNRRIDWVKPFTWSPERRIIPDIREDIMKHSNYFRVDDIATATWKNVEKEWKRKDFAEFSYITIEPPGWAKWVTWIVTILITGGLCYWAVVNDYVSDPDDPIKTITRWRRW
jgi:hypothetical protein